jgi:ribosomal protein L18
VSRSATDSNCSAARERWHGSVALQLPTFLHDIFRSLVVRFSNRDITAQIVYATIQGVSS